MEEFNSSLEQAIAQRQQRLLMDSLSMFGLGKWASGSYNQFLLIFDKSSPASTVHYLLIDTSGKKPQIHPKVNTVHMTKLTDVIGYRIAILLDSLYVMGGKHTLSDAYLSNCYSYDAMTNQWSRRAAMNKARIRFSATVINGILYICGEYGAVLLSFQVVTFRLCYSQVERHEGAASPMRWRPMIQPSIAGHNFIRCRSPGQTMQRARWMDSFLWVEELDSKKEGYRRSGITIKWLYISWWQ